MTTAGLDAPIDAHAEDIAAWRFVTARLLIRPIEPDDAEMLVATRENSPFVFRQRDLAQTREMLAEITARERIDLPGWHQFAMIHRSDGEMIGDIGVRFEGPGPEQAEIGYGLMPQWRGRGLAYEGVGRMLNHLLGDHGLHRVTATTDRRNLASRRLLESLRFRLEARLVQSYKLDGQWVDERGYARLAGE